MPERYLITLSNAQKRRSHFHIYVCNIPYVVPEMHIPIIIITVSSHDIKSINR